MQFPRAVYPVTVAMKDVWSVELPYTEMWRVCKAMVLKTMEDASGSSKTEYEAKSLHQDPSSPNSLRKICRLHCGISKPVILHRFRSP